MRGTVLALAVLLALCDPAPGAGARRGPLARREAERENRLDVPLAIEVVGPQGNQLPARAGIPFPQGTIHRPDMLRLRDGNNRELPLQTQTLSTWADGSVRWLLLDSRLDIRRPGRFPVFLAVGDTPRPSTSAVGGQNETSIRLASGLLELVLARQGVPRFVGLPAPADGTWELTVVSGDRLFRSTAGTATTRLAETGPLRGEAVIAGSLADGDDAPFRYEVRVSLLRESRLLECHVDVWPSQSESGRKVEEIHLSFGLELGAGTVAFGGDQPDTRFRRAGEEFRLRQETPSRYEATVDGTTVAEGNLADGWILADGFCLAVRQFANSPSRTLLLADHVATGKGTGNGGPMVFGLGFGLPSPWDAQRFSRRLDEPVLLHPGPVWLARSGGLGGFPLPDEDTAELESLFDPRDAAALFLQWARTGRRRWFDAALEDHSPWIPGLVSRYLFTGERQALERARRLAAGGGQGSWALTDLYEATRHPGILDTIRRQNRDVAAALNSAGAGEWRQGDSCARRAAVHALGLARSLPLFEGREQRRQLAALERLANWQLAYGRLPEMSGIRPSPGTGHQTADAARMLEVWATLDAATGQTRYRDLAEPFFQRLLEEGQPVTEARSLFAYTGWRQAETRPRLEQDIARPEADVDFLLACQHRGGGFGLVPGFPADLESTYRAIESLRLVGGDVPRVNRCAAWISSCRHTSGGYANRPGGDDPDVASTFFALHALALLRSPPEDSETTAGWLAEHLQREANENGGAEVDAVAYGVLALALLSREPPAAVRTRFALLSRQVDRGGFAGFGATAHTGSTALAATALRLLPKHPGENEHDRGLLAWLASLRRDDGGYGWPNSRYSTLPNTVHVLTTLGAIRASLSERELSQTRRFVLRCRSPQGGFGSRPGRTPTVLHTWQGIRAALLLGPEATPERSAAPPPHRENDR